MKCVLCGKEIGPDRLLESSAVSWLPESKEAALRMADFLSLWAHMGAVHCITFKEFGEVAKLPVDQQLPRLRELEAVGLLRRAQE